VTWLGFARPAWLAGLAALAAPVVIHLLSRGRQRRMPVGSVRWLATAATLRARRLRPSRWWLLAARCALLGLLVLLLAGPRLGRAPRSSPAWLLATPETVLERPRLEAANPELYARFDALLAGGASLRWLTAGLPVGGVAAPPASAAAADVWSLLRQADREAPPGPAFEVFVVDRLADVRGERPSVTRPLGWHAAADPSLDRWVERAVETPDGGLEVTLGESDAAGTRFARQRVGAATAAGAGWRLRGAGDERLVEVEEADAVGADDALAVSTPRLRAWILRAGERQVDARHVGAALAAAAERAGLTLELLEGSDEAAGAAGAATADGRPNLVFWLSPHPVGPAARAALAAGATLVSDALDRFTAGDQRQELTDGLAARFDRSGPVDGVVGGEPPLVLWGTPEQPLLDAQRVGAGTWLRFHGRFHPAWTDLVTTGALPQWLLEIVRRAAPVPTARRAASDRRSAGAQAAARSAPAVAPEAGHPVAVEPWLWLGLLAAAAGERWLAAGTVGGEGGA
jgi:Aerotolerance regulator N-terminal